MLSKHHKHSASDTMQVKMASANESWDKKKTTFRSLTIIPWPNKLKFFLMKAPFGQKKSFIFLTKLLKQCINDGLYIVTFEKLNFRVI